VSLSDKVNSQTHGSIIGFKCILTKQKWDLNKLHTKQRIILQQNAATLEHRSGPGGDSVDKGGREGGREGGEESRTEPEKERKRETNHRWEE